MTMVRITVEQQEWRDGVTLQTHLEGGVCKTCRQDGCGYKRRGDCGVWGEEGEGQGLHLLSWGRYWIQD